MIHHEDRGPVALLTIDRSERRNALDHEASSSCWKPTLPRRPLGWWCSGAGPEGLLFGN